ncbi:hypothetical protein K438DRAFT_1958251 [Mycena galopus ATCC 62051]|nr:hypothetical protein K438DRAFT_1958251 [Mycena galopus ATCC 62051]
MPSILSANRVLVRDTTQNKLPVGAMVGGLAGGVVAAILGLACYMLWAKATQRVKENRKREADAQHKTKSNTRHNALTKPWPAVASYRPMLLRPADTKVKFTEKPKGGDGLKTPSAPKPLRSAKQKTKTPAPPPMAGVPRLPSTVSSVSMYSAASAEEHQVRVPTSLILALGSIEAALTRASWGDRKGPQRVSQATSGSAYSQDVGVAY